MTTSLQHLQALGQSPWYDGFRRSYLTTGRLQALIDSGIRGITVNPSIFEQAILDTTDYDAAIGDLLARGANSTEIYERLLLEDITAAADLFRPLYDQSDGQDGFVSIELPQAGEAHDPHQHNQRLRVGSWLGRPGAAAANRRQPSA